MVGTTGGRGHFPEDLAEVYSPAHGYPTKSNWFLSLSGKTQGPSEGWAEDQRTVLTRCLPMLSHHHHVYLH